jgi:putative hydroxymethylpyrimidine transport system ATP-binding protein
MSDFHPSQPLAPAPASAGGPIAPGVRLRGARLTYAGIALFDGLDLDLAGDEITALLGPSGVGKSSLLRLIAGLEPDAAGEVARDDGGALPGAIALMEQSDQLLPWLSVRDNVLLGSRLRGEPSDRDRALALLERVGLAGRADDRPAALSGGMRQRAALARTLMEDRPIVLMDEPFSALDALTRLRLQDLAAELLVGRTVLMVTHDPMEALRLAHRIVMMHGRPARLALGAVPPGTPPRPAGEPELLRQYAQLLTRLEAAP